MANPLIATQLEDWANDPAVQASYSQGNSGSGVSDVLTAFTGNGSAPAPVAAAPRVDPGTIQAYAMQKVMQAFPNDPNAWGAMNAIVQSESGWNNNAQNPTSTAYGIGQFLDGTWEGTGYQKTSDPQTQVDATIKYLMNRYGTPSNALAFRKQHGWY